MKTDIWCVVTGIVVCVLLIAGIYYYVVAHLFANAIIDAAEGLNEFNMELKDKEINIVDSVRTAIEPRIDSLTRPE